MIKKLPPDNKIVQWMLLFPEEPDELYKEAGLSKKKIKDCRSLAESIKKEELSERYNS